MKVIHLDQPTAATMTSIKSALKVYEKKNVTGKYNDAVEKYNSIYKSLMDDVLGRNEETEKVLAA